MSLFKIFITIFFIIFSNINALASEKINFINIEYLFENSNFGKSITLNLKKAYSENSKILQSREKLLKDEENEIKKVQNIISEDEFNSRVSALKDKIKKFNKDKEVIITDFNKKKKLEFKNFFDKINPILLDYMASESIDIIFEKKNIFIGKSNHDITSNVLVLIDKKLN